MSAQRHSEVRVAQKENNACLLPYPLDMSSFLMLQLDAVHHSAAPSEAQSPGYNPITVTQYALACWNEYLAHRNDQYRAAFVKWASWLVQHEVRITHDTSGWPLHGPRPEFCAQGSCLSALAQGCAVSILVRAYQLTQEKEFLEVAHRAVRTFGRDILDGGVCSPLEGDKTFFEEVAVYPASHSLNGCIFGLLGLYEYVECTHITFFETRIPPVHAALHSMLGEFDSGFWTYSDPLRRCLSSTSQLSLQVALLDALAKYADCTYCSTTAARWKQYSQCFGTRFHCKMKSGWEAVCRALGHRIQKVLFPDPGNVSRVRACVSLQDFPVLGGVLTVLKGLAEVMQERWDIEYLAQFLGPGRDHYTVHTFGTRRMTPWYFPFIWLYVLLGARKFISLMRRGAQYHLLLPQDGVFSGALAGVAGKLTGVRVVCIDHGNLSFFTPRNMRVYKAERLAALKAGKLPWIIRILAQGLLTFYWPSLHLLARISSRYVDHFLIPGVAGDSVDEGCQIIGIHPSRVTRYGSMIDIRHQVVPDAVTRATTRESKGIDPGSMVVAIVCRLAPEKGLDIALESIHQALSALSAQQRARVCVIIAGDGPLRKHIEEDICRLGLAEYCLLWGELSSDEVIELLGISDIFLYTSVRGACYAMAILEAMASSCAVIASTEPLSNALLLSEGRGFAVAAGDIEKTSQALTRLLSDEELCQRMGQLAREYIALHHSPAMFKRTLLRATYWSGLDDLIAVEQSKNPAGTEGKY